METASIIFNRVTYYPRQLIRPINKEDVEHAISKDRTWYGRAWSQSAIGVRAALLALPVVIAARTAFMLWADNAKLPVVSPTYFPSMQQRYLMIFLMSVVAPVGEELFCRGVLQTTLTQSTHRLLGDTENAERHAKMVGIFLTALIFGGCHQGAPLAVTAFVGGLYLGWLKERTQGSLWAPMAAHTTHNTITVIAQLILTGGIIQ